ncbi:unnamed protein product, partial [Ectocarpus sp. 12 AP-2014]
EAFPADQGFGADKKSVVGTEAAAATGAATEAATGAVQEGGRRAQAGGWGEKGDRTGPGSIKQRLGAFLSRGSKNRSSKGRETGGGGASVARDEASSSGSRPPARGSVHDSVPDVPSVVEKSGAGTAAGAEGHANSRKKGPGSIKPRLEAFTSAGTFSSGGSSSSSGSLEGAEAGAGTGEGTSGKRSSGSIKNRLEAFTSGSGGGSSGSGEGDEAGAGVGASHRRGSGTGSVHDIVPDVPSVGERRGSGDHGRVGADLGWGEGANQTGPGSVKERLGAFMSGSGTGGSDEGEEAGAGASHRRGSGFGSSSGRSVHDIVPDVPSVGERRGSG